MSVAEDVPTVALVGGSGELGRGLAIRLSLVGIPVIVGSRRMSTAAEAVDEVRQLVPGARARGLLNSGAVQRADLVFLCVPFAQQAATIATVRDRLRPEQLVVDASVPLAAAVGGKPTRTLGVWQGSAAEQAQDLVPDGVRVVSALHTVSGAKLANLASPLREDVLVCGDRKADKQRVIALLDRVDGLRAIDCGRLEQARIVEAMTALLIGINIRHRVHAGVRITGLPAAHEAEGAALALSSVAAATSAHENNNRS